MSRQPARYPLGRAFPTLFISFFLGGVWGVTAAALLGIAVLFSRFAFGFGVGELCWHLLTGATLAVTLYSVQKVAGRTPPGADADETKRVQTDKLISVFSFAAAYVLAWAMLRAFFFYGLLSVVI